MEIILSKPVEWNGNSEKLELNLEGLTGSDLVQAEGEFMERHSGFVGMPTLQTEFQLGLAARALGRPLADLLALPVKDSLAIASAVQGFLFDSVTAGESSSSNSA